MANAVAPMPMPFEGWAKALETRPECHIQLAKLQQKKQSLTKEGEKRCPATKKPPTAPSFSE